MNMKFMRPSSNRQSGSPQLIKNGADKAGILLLSMKAFTLVDDNSLGEPLNIQLGPRFTLQNGGSAWTPVWINPRIENVCVILDSRGPSYEI